MPTFNATRDQLDAVMRRIGWRPDGSGWVNGQTGKKVGGGHTLKRNYGASQIRSIADSVVSQGLFKDRDAFMGLLRDEKNGVRPPETKPVGPPAPISVPEGITTWSKLLSHPKLANPIRVSIATITPGDALAMLNRHDKAGGVQRKLKAHQIERIRNALANDLWGFNGETIVIGTRGEIVNGRHRLTACVSAQKPIFTLLVTELPDPKGSFNLTDQVSARTIADVLGVNGYASEAQLASAIRVVEAYTNGNWSRSGLTSTVPLAPQRALEVAAAHKRLGKSIEFVRSVPSKVPKGVSAPLHYLFSLKDSALADQFIDALIRSEGLKRNSPLYLAHRRIHASDPLRREQAFFWIVRAWNATRKGEALLRMPSLAKGEALPRIE